MNDDQLIGDFDPDNQLLRDLLSCPPGKTDDDVVDIMLDELSEPLPDDEDE